MIQPEIIVTVIGGLFGVLFIGFMVLSFSQVGKKHRGHSRYGKIAGLVSLILGVVTLTLWGYIMLSEPQPASSTPLMSFVHLSSEFISGCMLLIAGVALLNEWRRGPLIFMVATAMILLTSLVSLVAFGPNDRLFLLNGVSVAFLVVGSYFAGMVYGWQHFVMHLDDDEGAEEQQETTKKSA